MIGRVMLTLLLLSAALPAVAVAGDKRAAAAHFQRGRSLFEASSYSAALDEFSAGYNLLPLPGFLVNIGQCQRKLDRLDDAALSFQKFLNADGGDSRLRAEVQEALSEIGLERSRRQSAALAAELEVRRQRDEAEARHPVEEAPARANLRLQRAPESIVARSTPASATVATAEEKPTRSRRWVWAVVGVLAAGAAAAAITVAVLETQPGPTTRAGSLGLLDGRR